MILLAGATGILGGLITQRLLGEGQDVRILVRHNSPAEEMAAQGMATSAQSLIGAGAHPVWRRTDEPGLLCLSPAWQAGCVGRHGHYGRQ